jgi:hypothetical protein
MLMRSQGSSVITVSGYRPDDWAMQVQSLTEAKNFSSNLWVQASSGAHPASCPMGTGGPFPGDKARPGRDADHSPPSSAKVENEWELYLLSLLHLHRYVLGLLYLYLLLMLMTLKIHQCLLMIIKTCKCVRYSNHWKYRSWILGNV